ncbi:hypothetical protein ACHHYP_06378 [Achlya hypogyna]|uniref:Retrotransposon gag domain-containing protein n=1 Tax=Achlya hypogyna TaxID=1202772 RepID=A0A1V9YUC7_ACHHY|nr:hypothetical protein ACHHYP_06378 [Achlya hypogyna]
MSQIYDKESKTRLRANGSNYREWFDYVKYKIYKEDARDYLIKDARWTGYSLNKDLRAAGIISQSVHESQLKYVEISLQDEMLPDRVFTNWAMKSIRAIYEGVKPTNKLELRRDFATLTWTPSESYDSFADKFKKLVHRLTEAGDKTPESERIIDFCTSCRNASRPR